MFKENDDGRGVVKVYWQDVRTRVAKVDSKLAEIIDKLSPDNSFSLYLAYYPYGAIIADHQTYYLPKDAGLTGFKIMDDGVSKQLVADLGYGKASIPMGIVLEKNMESSVELTSGPVPWSVHSPGRFMPFGRVFIKRNSRIYSPNAVLTFTSGIKSVFMLPNIGCNIYHAGLQRDYNIQSAAPKTLQQHWTVFKEIINSPILNCEWRSCMLFFSEKWAKYLHHDEAWKTLKLYLYELGWDFFEFERNRGYYDIIFSIIQEKRNLKPNPYLVDTAQHLYSILLGASPGYMPACNDDALPLQLLQQAYVESYGLRRYVPTVMYAAHFRFEQDTYPIYYSLKHPSTYIFSPKSRKLFSALVETRELEHINRIFKEELMQEDNMCFDTVLHEVAKKVEFKYFHNELDQHDIIGKSSEMPNLDDRLTQTALDYELKDAVFASDAPFVRGCVSMMVKNSD